MSEISELIGVVRDMLHGNTQLDKAQAQELRKFVMGDLELSVTERLFLKGLLADNRLMPEAVPVIRDVLDSKERTAELRAIVEQMTIDGQPLDKAAAIELRDITLENGNLSLTERHFLENLLSGDQVSPEGAAIIVEALNHHPE